MTDTIKRLRALHEAATEGPWEQATHVCEPRALVPRASPMDSLLALDADGMAIMGSEDDAELIAAMRNALPALLDVAEAAEDVCDHLYSSEWPPSPEGGALWRALARLALARLDGES